VSACEEKGVKAHAVTANIDGFDRGGSAAVAGEQLHTDGGIDQIAFERRRGDRHGFVAAGHFWTVSFAVANARWDVSSLELTVAKMAAACESGANRFTRLDKRREQCSE
jgi:hypothetical protein